jgi:hemerythrin superfamily protein
MITVAASAVPPALVDGAGRIAVCILDRHRLFSKEYQMPNRMDSMLSHGMGKMKAMKARLSGLVGVFKTLAEQHGEVKVLLDRAKSSNEKFVELWPTLRTELLSHERAEMRELYPLLRAYPETMLLANHHDAEAGELESLIQRIDALPPTAAERHALFEQLVDKVTHHAGEEERDIFPKAQDVLGKDRAIQLEKTFLAAKQQVAHVV